MTMHRVHVERVQPFNYEFARFRLLFSARQAIPSSRGRTGLSGFAADRLEGCIRAIDPPGPTTAEPTIIDRAKLSLQATPSRRVSVRTSSRRSYQTHEMPSEDQARNQRDDHYRNVISFSRLIGPAVKNHRYY
jgi:hypothetical protein